MLTPVPQDDRVRDLSLQVRLYTPELAHRLLPARAALAIATALGTPGKRHNKATQLRHAEHLMKDLLLHTPRADEARELARRNVKRAARLRELFWRPWLLKRSRVIGQEHWHAAHAGGRGCLVVVGHLGGLFALPGPVAARLRRLLALQPEVLGAGCPQGSRAQGPCACVTTRKRWGVAVPS